MKKDIQIPEVTGVSIVAVLEYNDIFKTDDWNIYLVNEKETPLEMVMVISKGFDSKDNTSVLRKKLEVLPANSFAKLELIQPELFKLTNQFQVTFFENNTLFEKTFTFKPNSIKEGNLRYIKSIDKKGILAK